MAFVAASYLSIRVPVSVSGCVFQDCFIHQICVLRTQRKLDFVLQYSALANESDIFFHFVRQNFILDDDDPAHIVHKYARMKISGLMALFFWPVMEMNAHIVQSTAHNK